ncbi:MAG: AMP-binding protein [Deltaproteobacteria bacterium]|nr:AMP-binding protein [Deltaproteobacteria bacterium]
MVRDNTIPAVFFQRVRELGLRTALRKKEFGIWQDISWVDYGRNVRLTALGLIRLGLNPGEHVSVIGENRPEWLYADLGTMAAGGITVGIYATCSAEECRYILDHSGSRFFIVENEEQLDKVLEVRGRLPDLKKIIVIDMDGLKKFKDRQVMSFEQLLRLGAILSEKDPQLVEKRLEEIDPASPALLIYTSGTTGPPKGAMLSHSNIMWTVNALTNSVELNDRDELLSFLPLSHIAERMFSVFIPLRAGYTLNFIENVDTIAQNMVEVSPTVFFAVPRIWEKYYSTIFIKMKDADWFKKLVLGLSLKIGARFTPERLPGTTTGHLGRIVFFLVHFLVFRKLKKRLGFDRIRLAVSGAAPISPDVLKFYHSIGIPLRQVYGQTEGSGPTAMHQHGVIEAENVGPPIPGVEVKIAEDGEILVRGGNVFLGYYKDDWATAETLADGWLHSGDVGELDERGFLKITDRKKDLIITSGGKNISPQYIENQLKFCPYIHDAVIIGDGRKFVTALIIIDEDNVVKYTQDHKIQFTTYAGLTQSPEIKKLILREVEAVNKNLARVEQIKKFVILPKKLYEEDGEVTPTMKVKRKYIHDRFRDLIEGMYRN